jgi:hypothetical protein
LLAPIQKQISLLRRKSRNGAMMIERKHFVT